MQKYLLDWQKKISTIERQLAKLNNETAKVKPVPNKWCINEILGHLIDSAINNHRRFILMQIQDTLVFDGYDQDKWVELQNYAIKDLPSLIETWEILNLNIISALMEINPNFWNKEFKDHSFDKILWKYIPEHSIATPEYFVKDYFGHLVHHLKQIFALGNIDFSI